MAKKQLTEAMKVVIATMLSNIKAGMSDVENLEACKTDKIGEDECTNELLNALLSEAKKQYDTENAAAAAAEKASKKSATMYGNKDKKSEYPFPSSWENCVVVRESVSTKVGAGSIDVVEIPSSVEIKPFDKSLFNTHEKQGMFKGKNVIILHDPR
jgi:hypothetical protein